MRNGRWLIDNVTPFEVPEAESVAPQPLAPTADMEPVAVTQAFYDWYLAYVGDQESGQVRNPLLTPEFVSRVDEIVAGFDGGDDPFLLAQDVPSTMIADAPAVVGPQVRVTVHRAITAIEQADPLVGSTQRMEVRVRRRQRCRCC